MSLQSAEPLVREPVHEPQHCYLNADAWPADRSTTRVGGPLLPSRRASHLEIIVPVLNEEHRLPGTLSRTVEYLRSRPWDAAIVVVDNGSSDRSAELVDRFNTREVPIHLLGCSTRGKGAAVRRGFLTGTSRYVGFMDADLATPIETLDDVMALLAVGHTAVVGSRHVVGSTTGDAQGALRQVGGDVFRRVARRAVPAVADTQCGFKFFRGTVARPVLSRCVVDGFAFDVELLARLIGDGHTITELPVRWSDVGGSTFGALRDGYSSLRDAARVRSTLGAEGLE